MYLILYIALFIGIVPLVVLLLKKRAFNFKEPIVPFIWLTSFATVYEFLGTMVFEFNTAYWFQFYSFLELFCLFYFFFKLSLPNQRNKLFLFLTFLYISYFISCSLWSKDSGLISNAINKSSLTLFVLFFSFLWFKKLIKNSDIQTLWKIPLLYFITAFLTYYSSTLILFMMSNFIFNNFYLNDFWWINIMATFLLRMFLIIGVWKMK